LKNLYLEVGDMDGYNDCLEAEKYIKEMVECYYTNKPFKVRKLLVMVDLPEEVIYSC
jgi:hypothetical protein